VVTILGLAQHHARLVVAIKEPVRKPVDQPARQQSVASLLPSVAQVIDAFRLIRATSPHT